MKTLAKAYPSLVELVLLGAVQRLSIACQTLEGGLPAPLDRPPAAFREWAFRLLPNRYAMQQLSASRTYSTFVIDT